MKRIALLIIYICTLLCQSCHDRKEDLPKPAQEAERTVIVYVAGENNLWNNVASDSAEMARAVGSIPDNCNLVLYMDRNTLPTITWMSAKEGVRLWHRYRNDQDSADSLAMLRTLGKIVKEFPAKRYGLVLGSHASGWIPRRKTFGIDNNSNSPYSNRGTEMEISTLRGVLEQLPHMDFILFDACMMQSAEVAHELRHVTDYTIGSPSEIPGNGAPYDLIMPAMMKGDAIGIASKYFEHYKYGSGVALSVVKCSMTDSLAQATAPLVESLWTGRREVPTDNVQRYTTFDEGLHHPEAQDIRSMMHSQLPDSTLRAWESVLQSTVVWHGATAYWTSMYSGYEHHHLTDPDHHCCLSMFVPQEKYEAYSWNHDFRKCSWYLAAGWSATGW